MTRFFVLAIAGLLGAADPSGGLHAEDPPRGVPITRIVCRSSPSRSYALYLPAAYTPDRTWPVLHVFDARGRALAALEVFRPGAERYGWILASSYDSRSDGPMAPNIEAFNAMGPDVRERVAIDPRRIYAAGFSGGARFSVWLAMHLKAGLAGVIGCGAGFPEGESLRKGIRFPFFGTVGDHDFNYYEMRALDRDLARLGARHRLAVFPGPHRWPPSEIGTRAIAWMEVEAGKEGLRPMDEAARQSLLEAALAEEPPVGTGTLEEEEQRDEADRRVLGTLEGRIGALFDPGSPLRPLSFALLELRVPELLQKASRPGRDALSAQRILEALFSRLSFYLFREMREKKDNARALLAVSLAAEIKPDDPTVLYNLACQRALLGERRRALEALRKAFATGVIGRTQIESDPDLASLRDEPEFRTLFGDGASGR